MGKLLGKILNKIINDRTIHMVLIFICTFLFTLIFSKNFFFWDTITEVSIPANFYYDTNFQLSFFGQPLASGHSTAIPFYLAAIWKIFGRSLIVSHFAFFPFVFGIIYLLYRYISRSGSRSSMILLMVMLVAMDPSFLSQA